MDMMENLWSGLESELVERVLSFLPVLELCRLRSVCSGWNKLICSAAFHDLCEQNRKENGYLFVVRHHCYTGRIEVDPRFKRTTSFLDLDSMRWCSLKPSGEVGAPRAARSREMCHWMLAMDHGLVCDMSYTQESATVFVISDPIARTRKELPESLVYFDVVHSVPLVVAAADPLTRSYSLFVITNDLWQFKQIFVYESVTNKWRAVKSPPENLGNSRVSSAVTFGGMLYVVFHVDDPRRTMLLSYHLQEDVWTSFNLMIPELNFLPSVVVSCNRLFVILWVRESSAPEHSSQSMFNMPLEVREFSVAENSSRVVAQLTTMQHVKIFGEQTAKSFENPVVVPFCSSSGSCKSLVFMVWLSGELISIDLASGLVVALPRPPAESNESGEDQYSGLYYLGNYTNLSLRNLSSPFLE